MCCVGICVHLCDDCRNFGSVCGWPYIVVAYAVLPVSADLYVFVVVVVVVVVTLFGGLL